MNEENHMVLPRADDEPSRFDDDLDEDSINRAKDFDDDMDRALTAKQLAARWNISMKTLSNWRCEGTGPDFFRPAGPSGHPRYRLADILAWEHERMNHNDHT